MPQVVRLRLRSLLVLRARCGYCAAIQTGLTNIGAKSFDQQLADVPGAAETSDRWGGALFRTAIGE
ncbi:hypothetical protein [Streptomyces chartreusis]|uniref:hypothetical protein n=1 Tax=Streptomyces chartreusis TaxID=1969 RepID=UPI0033EB5852